MAAIAEIEQQSQDMGVKFTDIIMVRTPTAGACECLKSLLAPSPLLGLRPLGLLLPRDTSSTCLNAFEFSYLSNRPAAAAARRRGWRWATT